MSKTEYISKQVVIGLVKQALDSAAADRQKAKDTWELHQGIGAENALTALQDTIEDHLRAADVREVVHARWLIVEYEFFTCSACGGSYYNGAESRAQAESYLNSGAAYAICPVCGAQMDLKPEA